MKGKITLLVLVLSLLLMVISGCWGSIELDQRAYVLALALDKGETENLLVTLFLPVPESLVKDAGDESYYIIQEEADSFYQALTVLQNKIDYQLYLGHLQMVLLGDALIKDGIDLLLDQLQEHQIGRNTKLFAVSGNAWEILENKPPSTNSIAQYLERYLRAPAKNDLKHYLDLGLYSVQKYTPGLESAIAYIELAEDKFINCLGLLLLKEGKMVGDFDIRQTQGFNIIQSSIGSAYTAVLDDEGKEFAQAKLLQNSPQLEVKAEGNEITALYTLVLEYTLISYISEEPSDEDKSRAEAFLASQIEERIKSALSRAQESNSDVFGIGQHLYYSDFAKWSSLDWNKAFPKVKTEINIKMSYKRTRKENK